MKTASSALAALINTGQFYDADCYTISGLNGQVYRYTTADFDIVYGGNLFSSTGPLIEDPSSRPTAHWKVGLDVDTWTMSLKPRIVDPITGASYPDTIGSLPWLAAATAGALDGARVLIERAYFSAPPALPIPVGGAVPVGQLTVFWGIVGEVQVGRTSVSITVSDMRSLLTVSMPRLVYQASCNHRLFDSRCTLSAATHKKTGICIAGSSQKQIVATVSAPSGSGTYTLGKIKFTSGLNAGISRIIRLWDTSQNFYMLNPFPYPVAVGDGFEAYPGCDKTLATCTLFGNKLNYGGTPFVPTPESTIA